MHLICFCAIATVSFAWDIPSYFPKCCLTNKFVSDCLIRSAIRIKPYLRNGVQEINLPQLYPLVVPLNDRDQIKQNAHDDECENKILFYGMHNFGIDHLEFYPQEILLKGKLTFNNVLWQASCSVHKNHLQMINNGESPRQLNITFLISGSLIGKYGKNYVSVEDVKIKTEVEPPMSKIFKKCYELEGNSKALKGIEDLTIACGTTTFDDLFTRALKQYLNEFLSAIPYSKIFPCSK